MNKASITSLFDQNKNLEEWEKYFLNQNTGFKVIEEVRLSSLGLILLQNQNKSTFDLKKQK